MGEILGAAIITALIGYLVAWLMRKATTLSYAQSIGIAVPLVTILGGVVYSFGEEVSFWAAWPLYAIGGVVALPLMMLGDFARARRGTSK